MKIYNLIQFLLFVSPLVLFAQAPDIEWEVALGGSEYDDAKAIVQTNDSGYIIAGDTWSIDGDISFNHGSRDFWITKLNTEGSLEWQKSYGGTGWEQAFSVVKTSDGGYIVAGQSPSVDGDVTFNHGGPDFWVLKIDEVGNLEWQKSYGGSNTEYAKSIIETSDGDYLIAGFSRSDDGDITNHHGIAENEDFWVIKINSSGEIIWQRSLGGSDEDEANSIRETSDGGYIVAGNTMSSDGDVIDLHGESDYWVVKLSVDGSIQWASTYGGSDMDEGNSIVQTFDEGFIVCGYSYSIDGEVSGHHGDSYADYWVLKLDTLGIIQWQKCLGGGGADFGYSVIETIDTNFIVSGFSGTDNDGDVSGHHGEDGYGDYWIVMLDTSGNIKWEQSYGGTLSDECFDLIKTIDSGYATTGWATSDDGDVTGHHRIETNKDYWVLKLEKPCDQLRYYADMDEDEFGNPDAYIYSCTDTLGFVLNDLDCNDTVAEIYPYAKDICNSIDDNCNSEIDENALFVLWYFDADNDDFGNTEIDSLSCFNPEGYVSDSADCDDTNPNIYPGATEILNGLDDDCDGFTDENLAINNTLRTAIKIYPNPAETILHIEYAAMDELNIEIKTITGQSILITSFNSSISIDISNYAAGIYFIKIKSKETESGIYFMKD